MRPNRERSVVVEMGIQGVVAVSADSLPRSKRFRSTERELGEREKDFEEPNESWERISKAGNDRIMSRQLLGIIALTSMVGCISSADPDLDPETMETGTLPISETGTPHEEGSTGSDSGDAPWNTTEGTSTGESDSGELDAGSSTGELDESSGTETGCELGTNTDCLACGHACSDEGTCTLDGCLEPRLLGHDEAFDDLGGLDGFLWGFPIELETQATLTHLAFIAGGAGGNVQLSLYTDADGSPLTRIVTSAPVENYAIGRHEVAVPSQTLEPGVYWLMATATDPTRIAMDINNGVVNFAVQGIERDYVDGHPNTLLTPIAFVNFRPNFYARFERLETE